MNQDRLWELISLKLSGEAKPEELAELEAFLQAQPVEGLRIEMLHSIWKSKKPEYVINKKEAYNRHLQRLSNHLSEPVLQYENPEPAVISIPETPVRSHKNRVLYWAAGIAASLLTIFLFTTINSGNKGVKANAQNTVSTKRGSKSKIQLPDGTQVWLNADSRITYKENFQDSKREVELTGEAFFDVVRDETRPFIIHTSTIDVKVLGTTFNVRSYADEKNTETSLIHGSIEITLVKSADKRTIILKPNDKLIVNNDEASFEQGGGTKTHNSAIKLSRINYKKKDSSAVETLWVQNKLAFDEEPFEQIALKIERWYDVKLNILDEQIKKEPYTATFDHETLPEVMEAMKEVGGFKYSINKKEVTIRR